MMMNKKVNLIKDRPQKAEHRSQVLPCSELACPSPGALGPRLHAPGSSQFAPFPQEPPGQSHPSTLNPYGTALGGQA